MRKAIVIIAVLALLPPATVVAQDEMPEQTDVTVVPDAQFCNLVADDVAACEEALQTLASAGMLPNAFAVMISPTPARGGSNAAAGDAIVMEGAGSVAGTRPFDLDGGDYEVTMTMDGCSDFGMRAYLKDADADRTVERFEQSGFVYSIDGGRHFWDVIAGGRDCEWSLTLTPLSD